MPRSTRSAPARLGPPLPPSPVLLVGESTAFLQTLERARRLASLRRPVLIQGPTGSGKELFARYIHEQSGRAGPLVAVNCAALPGELAETELFGHKKGAFSGAAEASDGLVGKADGGTLFLDEVAELTMPIQLKLLRFLQDGSRRKVGAVQEEATDVRVIAATNQPVDQLVAQGKLRSDLYFRLNVLELIIPALKDRQTDVLRIAEHLLREEAELRDKHLVLTPSARAVLLGYTWPGNIRELQSALLKASLEAQEERLEGWMLEHVLKWRRPRTQEVSSLLQAMPEQAWVTSQALSELTGLSSRRVVRELNRLKASGAVDQEGSRRGRRYRKRGQAERVREVSSGEDSTERGRAILEEVSRQGQATRQTVMEALQLPARTVNRELKRLTEEQQLEVTGRGRATHYRRAGSAQSRPVREEPSCEVTVRGPVKAEALSEPHLEPALDP